MKLHIGSGSVYLLGYLNLDVRTPKTFLGTDRPDLIEQWAVSEDNYYAKHANSTLDSFRAGALDQEYVCDKYGSFTSIPLAPCTVSEVLTRQAFEHMSYTEARSALEQIETVLEPEGILRIDVPDHEETVRLLAETGDKFYVRHLYGSRRDDYGYHVMSYTRDGLRKLVESCGFVFQFEEPNIHPYPAFTLRFIKSSLPPPCTYVETPVVDGVFADLGPGSYPHPRANLYIDYVDTHVSKIKLGSNQRVVIDDLATGLKHIRSQSIDYLWASHVLEHVEDVDAALKTIVRIAKRGVIIVPSAIKESLFNFEEVQHKWLVLPHPQPGLPPIFIRRNGYYDGLVDVEVQRAMCRLYRTGPNRHEESQYLRNWYKTHEPQLDVVIRWEGEIKVQVIE